MPYYLLCQSVIERKKLVPTAHAPFKTIAAAQTFGSTWFKHCRWAVGKKDSKGYFEPVTPTQHPNKPTFNVLKIKVREKKRVDKSRSLVE